MRIRCRSGFLPIGMLVLRQLQRKEDEYRAANPSWVDQTDVHDDLRQQWHEAQANRRMQFKVGNFKLSEIRMLTGTKSKQTGSNSLLRDTWRCFPLWSKVSLQGCSKSKLTNTLWTTGVQRSLLCPQCGLMSPWWGPTIFARWLVTTFITCRRSTEYLVCGVMFARGGGSCNSTLRQLGRDGIQWRRERRDSSPTGPINLGMIWRMKSGLMAIGMRGKSGGLLGTDYGDYVSQAPHSSFLVSTGFLRAFMTRYERKSMLYRYSSLEVSKMCQLAERKRGSKPRIPLLAHSCLFVHWTLTISCWRRSESRGCVDSRESLSLFHLFTMIGLGHLLVLCLCLWGGFVLFGSVFDVLDLSLVSFVYLWQLTTRYNDCQYRDGERSISPKKL